LRGPGKPPTRTVQEGCVGSRLYRQPAARPRIARAGFDDGAWRTVRAFRVTRLQIPRVQPVDPV